MSIKARILFPAALSAVLAACTPEPKIHLTDQVSAGAHIDAAIKKAPKRLQADAQDAKKAYVASIAGGERGALPNWKVVNGMTVSQFSRYVRNVLAPLPVIAPPDPDVTAADPAVTHRYLESLRIERELSEMARGESRAANLFTVDQFEWSQPAYIPPPPDAYSAQDHATFALNFTNKSDLDVYPPTFRLKLTSSSGEVVFDNVLLPDSKAMIVPLEPVLLLYTCCSYGADPLLNQSVRALDEGARFEYRMTEVKDFSKRNMLDTTSFNQERNHRLLAVTACIADIESRIDTWTPATAVDACRG